MRTFIIGSKTLSCVILDTLLENGHEVLGVYARDDEPGMKTWHELGHRNLAQEAERYGIPVHLGMQVNSARSLELIQSLDLDLILSCFWSEIFKEPILNLPKLGVYNFHMAKLPQNRGSRPLPWAMIKGEQEAGITVHRMMTGVDNGPIVAQKSFAITDEDTGKTLYDKAHSAGADLVQEVIDLFAQNAHRLVLQDENQASYQPRGEPYGRMIDPYWSKERKDRFKRAFDFPPFAGALEAPRTMEGKARIYVLLNTECRTADDVDALERLASRNVPVSLFASASLGTSSSTHLERHRLGPEESDLQLPLEKTASSRFVMHQLRQSLDTIQENEGIRPDVCGVGGIHESYRPLDLLLRRKTPFISSRLIPLDEAGLDLVDLQPHFHLNGVLELPSLAVDCSRKNWEQHLAEVIDQAKHLKEKHGRDIFIGCRLTAQQLIDFLDHPTVNEVFEVNNVGFSTYGEVCAHYHSIYSNS